MAIQQYPKTTTVNLSELGVSNFEDGATTRQNTQTEPNRLHPAQTMSKEEFHASVKKIRWKADLRLIGMAWLMFIFNHFDRVSLAPYAIGGQTTNPDEIEYYCGRKSDWHANVTEHDHHRVRTGDCNLVPWLHDHANPFELHLGQAAPVIVSSCLHVDVGRAISRNGLREDERRTVCCPVFTWIHGSAIFCGMPFFDLILVYEIRAGSPQRPPDVRAHARQRLFRSSRRCHQQATRWCFRLFCMAMAIHHGW